jgi:hypothetical protein
MLGEKEGSSNVEASSRGANWMPSHEVPWWLGKVLAVGLCGGVHGMVVFGDNPLYLYHLPMWHGLHESEGVLS